MLIYFRLALRALFQFARDGLGSACRLIFFVGMGESRLKQLQRSFERFLLVVAVFKADLVFEFPLDFVNRKRSEKTSNALRDVEKLAARSVGEDISIERQNRGARHFVMQRETQSLVVQIERRGAVLVAVLVAVGVLGAVRAVVRLGAICGARAHFGLRFDNLRHTLESFSNSFNRPPRCNGHASFERIKYSIGVSGSRSTRKSFLVAAPFGPRLTYEKRRL